MKNAIFSEIRLLILCGILGWTAGMAPAACYAQEGQAQSVRVDAYHFRGSAAGAYPGATYEIVTAHRVLDRDNNNYYLDPSGETRLRTLELISAGAMRPGSLALMGKITGTAGSGYYINLNSNPGGAPMVYVHSLQTSNRITWDDPYSFSPFPIDDTAIGGKHVYDIAEGIQARGCAAGDVV
ncbi:MAG: hypothetical protein PHO30_08460, partial [Candidatus Omnitrophica bacterium]|nr:hypothetical protein [Candidatus Omnitrophota bacterium]